MIVKSVVKTSEYHDSVSLMLAARDLARLPGVGDAAVVMATEANKGILREAGLLTAEAQAATPNDLVIAVRAAPDCREPEGAMERALAEAERLLQKKGGEDTREGGERRPKTLRAAVRSTPGANVAVISVAGRYAAAEAWEALRQGLHVLLFSDNVSLEDEIALKRYAVQNGLLLMGPGAGTAILNGVALGFANVVPPGPVGIVSAAGTGLQEVSALLAKSGVGITQGIGTGGRDLKEEVGGLMMLAGLRALQADPATEVIVLVSKPPSPDVARQVLDQARARVASPFPAMQSPSPETATQSTLAEKPVVVCFLGQPSPAAPPGQGDSRIAFASTLEAAARLAAHIAGAGHPEAGAPLAEQAAALRGRLAPGQCFLRGLFSGGTLCYEAQVIWRDLLAEPVRSNAPLDSGDRLHDSNRSLGHTAVDLGEEEFTVGRPHPMIDNDLRIRRLLQEARDPETAVVMLDVVLGYGAHPDPASELAPAVRQARQIAGEAGRELLVVASVTGTQGDPQGLDRQVQALEAAGVVVCASNAAAARLVAGIVQA